MWVAASFVVVAVATTTRHELWGAARNDDWAYLETLFAFAAGDGWTTNGWAMTGLVGQTIVTAAPVAILGNHIVVAQIATLGAAAAGLLAWRGVYGTLLSAPGANIAVAATAGIMTLAANATTYMSDVWAWSFVGGGLWALTGTQPRVGCRTIAGVGLLMLAATTRELTAVVIVGVIVVAARAGQRAVVGISLAGLLGTGAVLSIVRPLDERSGFSLPNTATATLGAGALSLMIAVAGIGVAGAVALWHSVNVQRRVVVVAGALAVVAGAVTVGNPSSNHLHPGGGHHHLGAGGSAHLGFHHWWYLFCVLAALSTVGLGLAPRRAPSPQRHGDAALVTTTAVISTVATVGVAIAFGWPIYDRYWLVPASALIGVIAHNIERHNVTWKRQHLVAAVAVATCAALYSDAVASIEGGYWRAGNHAVAELDVPAATVDAGFAWVGWHRDGDVDVTFATNTATWWTSLLPHADTCATITTTPADAGAQPVTRSRPAVGIRQATYHIVHHDCGTVTNEPPGAP